MDPELDLKDWKFILESLKYSKLKFEDYNYPTQEFKQDRINEVVSVISKVQISLKGLKNKFLDTKTCSMQFRLIIC